MISEKIRILDRAGLPPIPRAEKAYVDWLSTAGAVLLGGGIAINAPVVGLVVAASFAAIQLGSKTEVVKKAERRAELLFSFDRFRERYFVPGLVE